MAAFGWFLLGAFIAPGVSWWRAGRKGLGLVVACAATVLPTIMMLIAPRAPRSAPILFAVSSLLAIAIAVQSVVAAIALRRAPTREPWSSTGPFLIAVVLLGIPARLLPRLEFETFQMPSESMQPSLVGGDQFFALKDRDRHPIERGSVIVFFDETRQLHFVKRVIGLPGDTVTIEGISITINGTQLQTGPCPEEPFPAKCVLEIAGEHRWRVTPGFRLAGTWQVSPGSMFVVGDNLDNSEDSRTFGDVPLSSVIGVAKVIHFSWPNVLRSGKSIDPEP